MLSRIKYCATCAFRAQDGAHCGLDGKEININEDFCSKHKTSPDQCELCGNFIISNSGTVIDVNKESPHIFCWNCFKMLNTCRACKNSNICEFETNPSSIPKVVNQQVRQGNMVFQTQIRNPERIQKFCFNCGCWNDNNCNKENGSCKNYIDFF